MRYEGGGVKRRRHDPMAIIGKPFDLSGFIHDFNPFDGKFVLAKGQLKFRFFKKATKFETISHLTWQGS